MNDIVLEKQVQNLMNQFTNDQDDTQASESAQVQPKNNPESVTFADLGLPDNVLRAIQEIGYSVPTPIQQQAIPELLAGKNVLGEAQTGTGKTAAFSLPALGHLDARAKGAQMLVVAPTRELAIQVAEQVEAMAHFIRGLQVATVYGGSAYGPQMKLLKQGAQVVVGTPGRLMDHMRRGSLRLDNLRVAVLDEADEMLNMGFLDDIEWIMEQVPETAQRCLFSATMPKDIKKIADRFLGQPTHIKIASSEKNKAKITQKAWRVQGLNKNEGLERVLEISPYELALVFVRTRQDTLDIASYLREKGFTAAALNGDMTQEQRESTLDDLKAGRIRIMVATDVVARGVDIPEITHVINYDLPQDTESYVHRIGRTGRAGREGEAISFVRGREMHMLSRYERATKGKIELFDIPFGRELTKFRIAKVQSELLQTMESPELDTMKSLINQIVEGSERSLEEIAAALLYEYQKKRPLIVKEEKPRRDRRMDDRRDRGERAQGRGRRGRDDRNDRNARDGRPGRDDRRGRKRVSERANVKFDTFRLAVGKNHGTRPRDVVGAIANEINLDSRYIGEIDLHDNHTMVQLPADIPHESLKRLEKVRIRSQRTRIERVS